MGKRSWHTVLMTTAQAIHRQFFMPRRRKDHRMAVLLLLSSLVLVACAGKTTELTAGGFAASNGDALSLAVAQARAQFPELSAQGMAYVPREAKPESTPPMLALQGSGTGFSRGLQLTERTKGSIKLYLDKTSYARGYAVVKLGDAGEERWPIVAYELRGKASDRFEFSYMLEAPDGGLRYLVILGGTYSNGGKDLLAYEGTLFIPTPGKGLAEWARAYKFDFGFKYPVRPAYQEGVDEAETLFRELQGDIPAIDDLSERLERARQAADAAKRAASTASGRGPDPAALDAKVADLKAQRDKKISETEVKALHYYEVRTQVDNAYAAFVLSNPFTWRDVDGETDYYQRWQKVEFEHPLIDQLMDRLVTYLPDAKRLETSRAAAMALFAKNDNWDKNPAKKAVAPESGAAKPEKPAGM